MPDTPRDLVDVDGIMVRPQDLPRYRARIPHHAGEPAPAEAATPSAAETTGPQDTDGEQPAYDPGEHTVDEVLDHLAAAGPAEVSRVLDAEAAGKNRKTLADHREQLLGATSEHTDTAPPAAG